MPKIVTIEQMRAIEQAANAKKHTYADMMARAGAAVAMRVDQLVAGLPEPRIAVLVGPGNNGGDGLVAARTLASEIADASVGVFLLEPRGDDDAVFVAARDAGVLVLTAENDKAGGYRALHNLIGSADVVIDALFGTSVRLPIKGDAAKVLQNVHRTIHARHAEAHAVPFVTPADPAERVEENGPIVIAVDCPSGLDCDSGALDPNAIPAHETITFGAAKPGLFIFPGADAVGTLHVADIGLPAKLVELESVSLTLVDAAQTGALLPARPRNSHTGTFGKVMIVAGSLNYTGAAYLSAAAAYRAGAGLVTVGAPQIIIPTLAGMLPEATWILLPHDMGVVNGAAQKVLRKELEGYSALLVGPGLSHEDVTAEFLRELLRPKEEVRRSRAIGFVPLEPANPGEEYPNANLPPLILDADALNLLAEMDEWPSLLPPDTIITPHPGEFARLAQLATDAVQADRLALAQAKAAEWQCVVVLKGAFTVIAAPDGRAAIQPFATAALARAGTGDVLAGAIVGLRAQGLLPYEAAVAGAWLHGMAGARAEALLGTAASVTADEVLEMLSEAVALAEHARA